jgi:hypothetical protein
LPEEGQIVVEMPVFRNPATGDLIDFRCVKIDWLARDAA